MYIYIIIYIKCIFMIIYIDKLYKCIISVCIIMYYIHYITMMIMIYGYDIDDHV